MENIVTNNHEDNPGNLGSDDDHVHEYVKAPTVVAPIDIVNTKKYTKKK